MMTNLKLNMLPLKKGLLVLSALFLVFSCIGQKTSKERQTLIQLNKNYQFVTQVNGKFFCRGTFVFGRIDENGLWHGHQNNATQQNEILVTATMVNDSLEIYTAEPWKETWKVNSVQNGICTGTVSADYRLAQNRVITFELRAEGIPLDKTYQFTSHVNGKDFCKGMFHFYEKDENGIWHGSQKNETQKAEILVTAKMVNDSLEIYTSGRWNETWKVTSMENGTSSGSVSANYSLAQNNNITFELSEIVNKN